MVRSMTGYGRARQTLNGRDITVEVRSVNNRYLDCTVKMPRTYVFAEDAIKSRVQKSISRGKTDVFITIESAGAEQTVISVNESLARGYFAALTQLKDMFSLEGEITPTTLAKFPDVLTVTRAEEDLEAVSADICLVLDEALAAHRRMREVEGAKLAQDVLGRADTIESIVGELLQSTPVAESRLLTEAAIFADKIAVDEETVRLHSHLAQLRTMLQGDEPIGRKLDFLIQEINRECNTTGSKCSDITIARDVVDMKAEVEKIREQIQNIE